VSAGRIRIGGRDVTKLQPAACDIAMVFQNYALYPHMTVRQNLGYGLRARKMPSGEARARVEQVARMLGLSDCSTGGRASSRAGSSSGSRWAGRSSASRPRS
jgi:multiple sugar transport system ATP-binding protein